jgi:hypothetical protein
VLKDGKVRFEQYWRTGGRKVQWISISVAMSFTSALVGIAMRDGLIKSLDDSIIQYAPKLGLRTTVFVSRMCVGCTLVRRLQRSEVGDFSHERRHGSRRLN